MRCTFPSVILSLNRHNGHYANNHSIPTMDWNVERQPETFTRFCAMADLWIAAQKISTEIQFTTIILTLGKEEHLGFQSFKLGEDDCKDPMLVLGCFGKSMSGITAYWINWDETFSDLCQRPSEIVESLNIRNINLIDLCKYPYFCGISKIKIFMHTVKHLQVCH